MLNISKSYPNCIYIPLFSFGISASIYVGRWENVKWKVLTNKHRIIDNIWTYWVKIDTPRMRERIPTEVTTWDTKRTPSNKARIRAKHLRWSLVHAFRHRVSPSIVWTIVKIVSIEKEERHRGFACAVTSRGKIKEQEKLMYDAYSTGGWRSCCSDTRWKSLLVFSRLTRQRSLRSRFSLFFDRLFSKLIGEFVSLSVLCSFVWRVLKRKLIFRSWKIRERLWDLWKNIFRDCKLNEEIQLMNS